MAVQPQAGIALSQGDGDAAEEVSNGGGGNLNVKCTACIACSACSTHELASHV